MKVLVIGSRIPFPLHDGGAIATFNMLKGLSDNGADVTYISLNTHKHYIGEETVKKEFSFLKAVKTFKINTDIKASDAFKNLFSKDSYNIERFYHPEFERILLTEIQDTAYDVIHFEGLFVAKYIFKIKAAVTTPTILRQHNIEFKIWERLAENEKDPLKRWYLNLLAKRMKAFELNIVQAFDSIVTIAETDEAIIRQWDNVHAVSTIHSGFETKALASPENSPELEHSLYHIGSMEWLPNREAMMWFHFSIWPRVIQAVPNARFFMAGKNMPSKFETWTNENFIVSGEVENASDFSADKQILVVPLKSASGIRIKTIEAMLAGKAVVTTSIGAKGLPVENMRHCIIADEWFEFVDAIIFLMRNPEKRIEMAGNGRKLMIENYEINAVAKQWIATYRSMIGL